MRGRRTRHDDLRQYWRQPGRRRPAIAQKSHPPAVTRKSLDLHHVALVAAKNIEVLPVGAFAAVEPDMPKPRPRRAAPENRQAPERRRQHRGKQRIADETMRAR